MKLLFRIIFLLSIFQITWKGQAFAQQTTSKADSIKQAIREKRSADSLAREITKLKNKATLDSIKQVRVEQRKTDSTARVIAKNKLLQERKTQDSLKKITKERLKDSLLLDKERIALERKNKVALTPKQLEQARLDSLKQVEVAEKMLLRAIELREKDSLAAIEKIEQAKQKRVADSLAKIEFEQKQLEKIAKQKTKDSLDQLEKIRKEQEKVERDIQLAKEKAEKEQKKQEADSLANIELEKKRLEKIAKQKTKDSLFQLEKIKKEQEKVEREIELAKEKAEKEQKKQEADSLAKIELEQKQLEKIAKQKIKDSIDLVEKDKKEQRKLETIADQKTIDIVNTTEKISKKASKQKKNNKLDANNKFEEEQRIKDSIQNVINLQTILVKTQQQKTKDSLASIAKKKQDSLLSSLLENKQQIDDSLQLEKMRIQKMNERIRKQQIEDSLYVAHQKDTTLNIDSLFKAIVKTEADAKKKAIRDSLEKLLVNEIIPETKQIDTFYIQPEISLPPNNTKLNLNKKQTMLSFQFGLSNYLGDLGGNSGKGRSFIYDNNFKQRTYFYGIGLTRHYHKALSVRFNYMFGNIAGSDQDVEFKDVNDPAYFRHKRNLDFKSKISEFSVSFEFYPFQLHANQSQKSNLINSLNNCAFQPYLLGGIGRFKFNPQGSYYDIISEDYIWIDLQPLKLEGQGMNEYPTRSEYSLSQFNLPYGLGFRYAIGTKSFLSFEFIGRKLFTDYLDDVSTSYVDPTVFGKYFDEENTSLAKYLYDKSNLINPNDRYKAGDQRGNDKSNDFYYSFNLKLSVQINKNTISSKKAKKNLLKSNFNN